jgi:hypothetical protein
MAIAKKSKNLYSYQVGDYMLGFIRSADGQIQEALVMSIGRNLYTITCNPDKQDLSEVARLNGLSISAMYQIASGQFDKDPQFHLPKRVSHALMIGAHAAIQQVYTDKMDMDMYRREIAELQRKLRGAASLETEPAPAPKAARLRTAGITQYGAQIELTLDQQIAMQQAIRAAGRVAR